MHFSRSLIAATLLLMMAPYAGADDSQILARVGDTVITEREFQIQLTERYTEAVADGRDLPPNRQFRLAVLNEMVRARLIQILARNKGLAATDEERESAMRDFTRLRGGAEGLEQWMSVRSFSMEDVTHRIGEKIASEKLLHHFADENAPDEDEIESEYGRLAALGAMNRLRPTVDFAHIFVEAKDDTDEAWDAAKVTVEKARERIVAGESFHEVAQAVSEDIQSVERGGRYLEISEGEVPAAIEERMFKLEPGVVSEAFRSELGWHIMLVEQVNPEGETVPYEKAQDRIREVMSLSAAYEALSEALVQLHAITRVELAHAEAQMVPFDTDAPE